MKELAADLVVALFPEIVATSGGARLPTLARKLHSPVSKKRVVGNVVFLLLPKHHVDGVVQHHVGNASGWFRHEYPGVGFTSGQIRQGADMILMSMGDNDVVDLVVGNELKIWRSGEPFLFRVHAAVEND